MKDSDGLLLRHQVHTGSCWPLRRECEQAACRQLYAPYKSVEVHPDGRTRDHCHSHPGEIANGHRSPVRVPVETAVSTRSTR